MKKRSVSQLASSLGIPDGVVGNEPVISLFGTRKVTVESHGVIYEYTQTRIRVDSVSGVITVCGNELNITLFTKRSLEITGIISSVEVETQ